MQTTTTPTPKLRPAYHAEETPEAWLLWAEIPGCSEQSVELSVEEGHLRLSAQADWKDSDEGLQSVLREYGPRTYSRAFQLPVDVETDGIEAKVTLGILEVRLPKKQRSVRSIPIQTS